MFTRQESMYTRLKRLTHLTPDPELALLSQETSEHASQRTKLGDELVTNQAGCRSNTRAQNSHRHIPHIWNSDNPWRWQNLWFYKCLGNNSRNNKDDRPYRRGWPEAVRAAAVLAGSVFVMNLIFTIVMVTRFPADHGVGQIYEGNCAVVKRWNTAVHLLINLLSTLLLGASNYTMQVLSSPTRSEVDAAHSKGFSLEIGLLNVRNFRHMNPKKGFLWLFLCLSTMPLHFLWNSAIFTTGVESLFGYLIVDEGIFSPNISQNLQFLEGDPCTVWKTNSTLLPEFMFDQYRAGNFKNISAIDCFNKYNDSDGTVLRNLILVTDHDDTCTNRSQTLNASFILAINDGLKQGPNCLAQDMYENNPFYWYGDNVNIHEGINDELSQNHTWSLDSYPVLYCLSEQYTAPCKLQYASFILYVVVACNLIKLVCMAATVVYVWDLKDPILAIIGDAAASFLDHEDKTTVGLCLMDSSICELCAPRIRWGSTKESEKNILWKDRIPRLQDVSLYLREPKTRLSHAEADSQKFILLCLGVIFWIGGLCALGMSSYTAPLSGKPGAVSQNALLNIDASTGSSLFTAIIFANSPQTLFSIMYVLYNTALTAKCGGLEWASYAKELTPLRVTWPTGHQRSTYFLHLPWKYIAPLTIVQILMHFLLSQSVFLARLIDYDAFGTPTTEGFQSVGYASSGILAVLVVWTAMGLAMIGMAFVWLDNRIPIHGNKSVVISALCHADNNGRATEEGDGDERLSTKPLMWGVTKEPWIPNSGWEAHGIRGISPEAAPGHCTFSDQVVKLPMKGLRYA